MIAALYVETGGCYFGLPDVDPWDLARDARLYAGPWPVVAHPPCNRWCAGLADVNQARYGHRVGDDGGTFAAALASVRRWGGVLEHPAYTHAWSAFGLPEPFRAGWQRTTCGGWVCRVSQVAYGHPARKRTWLYAVVESPPPMLWTEPPHSVVISSDATLSARTGSWGAQNARSPLAFRDALLAIARSALDAPARRASVTP